MKPRKLKICIACSAGGHLMEAMEILPALKNQERFFVTFRREQVKDVLRNERTFYVVDPKRNPKKLLENFRHAMEILRKENPDIIISTGAAAAVPLCYAARILGKRIVFIESVAAVNKPSLSGRAVYPIADLFVIQWKGLRKYYKNAVYGGQLI